MNTPVDPIHRIRLAVWAVVVGVCLLIGTLLPWMSRSENPKPKDHLSLWYLSMSAPGDWGWTPLLALAAVLAAAVSAWYLAANPSGAIIHLLAAFAAAVATLALMIYQSPARGEAFVSYGVLFEFVVLFAALKVFDLAHTIHKHPHRLVDPGQPL